MKTKTERFFDTQLVGGTEPTEFFARGGRPPLGNCSALFDLEISGEWTLQCVSFEVLSQPGDPIRSEEAAALRLREMVATLQIGDRGIVTLPCNLEIAHELPIPKGTPVKVLVYGLPGLPKTLVRTMIVGWSRVEPLRSGG